ncbi:MAG: hypothetical protein KF768_10605 [Phycisphaeraceae bacterium]|nr:hypothetical protein [Phycisphaeraceae bacterium]
MHDGVVITGIGCVSAVGLGWPALWNGLVEGRAAIGTPTRLDASGFRSKLAGQVPDFKATEYVPKSYRKAVKVMARDTELAVVAARFAVEDAGIATRGTLEGGAEGRQATYASGRMGCHIGAGLIAADSPEMAEAMSTARDEGDGLSLAAWGGGGAGAGTGMEQLTPLWLLKYLPNMLACHVTIIHGCEGPSNTITCAEASGLLCVGESTRVIQRGDADLCFSGGCESKLNPMGMLRLDLAGWTAPTGDESDGSAVIRPYDPASKGALIGEGGAILILESTDSARKRGAKVYASVAGYGGGMSDAFYTRAPDAVEGYESAVRNALDDAKMTPEQIDAIVPMASGIPALDRAEAAALRAVFGERLPTIPLVTLAPNVGLCSAGAAALQVAVAAGCLHQQRLPARLHAGSPEKGLDAGRVSARSANLQSILVCTGSMGGTNAAVVLRRAGA